MAAYRFRQKGSRKGREMSGTLVERFPMKSPGTRLERCVNRSRGTKGGTIRTRNARRTAPVLAFQRNDKVERTVSHVFVPFHSLPLGRVETEHGTAERMLQIRADSPRDHLLERGVAHFSSTTSRKRVAPIKSNANPQLAAFLRVRARGYGPGGANFFTATPRKPSRCLHSLVVSLKTFFATTRGWTCTTREQTPMRAY